MTSPFVFIKSVDLVARVAARYKRNVMYHITHHPRDCARYVQIERKIHTDKDACTENERDVNYRRFSWLFNAFATMNEIFFNAFGIDLRRKTLI